jgi:leucyl-tRNA synthetase
MVLHDLGMLHFDEPFRKFRAHGLIVKDGAKMSKSRGNVVIPDEYIAQWGADTFRMYLMFLGPFQEGGDFRDEGISGPRRFLDKVWTLVTEAATLTPDSRLLTDTRLPTPDSGTPDSRLPTPDSGFPTPDPRLLTPDSRLAIKRHQTVKRVTEGLEELRYNTSIAALMELVNTLRAENAVSREVVEDLIVMLAPFAPHFAEENWERLGHEGSIFDAPWPTWDERLTVEDTVEIAVQVSGKTRSRVTVPRGADEAAVVAAAQADAAVRRFTEGKEVRKVVYVPNRLLNLVVG